MIKSIISVIFTEIKFCIIKLFHFKYFCFRGIQRFSPNTEISIERGARFELGEKVRAHSGSRFHARKNGRIIIGNDVAFNYNCMLTAYDEIVIKDGVEVGPGVLFYDHDHNVHGYSIKDNKFNTAPICIGDNVWIGANAVILRGVTIEHDSVVAAGTVVRRGHYPANSLIYEKKDIVVINIE